MLLLLFRGKLAQFLDRSIRGADSLARDVIVIPGQQDVVALLQTTDYLENVRVANRFAMKVTDLHKVVGLLG